MDAVKEEHYIFNWNLLKIIGLHKVLSPDTLKIRGYNVFHILIFFVLILPTITVLLQVPLSLYYLSNDVVTFSLFFGHMLSMYVNVGKMSVILYHSNDIWNVIISLSLDSLTYRFYDQKIVQAWRKRINRILNSFIIFTTVAFVFWCMSPIISKDAYIITKNLDGSLSYYRQGIMNIIFTVSDSTYNEYYDLFVIQELLAFSLSVLTLTYIDVIFIITSFAICCELDLICNAVEGLGHMSYSNPKDNYLSVNNFKRFVENDTSDVLKLFMIDLQTISKSTKQYYDIFRTAILADILVQSYTLVGFCFNLVQITFGDELIDPTISSKVLSAIPLVIFQLFMTCHLFGVITEHKESITFALYSSNWTEMNMRSKKFVLLAMHFCESDKNKIKFTSTKVVDIEFFVNALRVCYSVYSMLINKKNMEQS